MNRAERETNRIASALFRPIKQKKAAASKSTAKKLKAATEGKKASTATIKKALKEQEEREMSRALLEAQIGEEVNY